MIGVHVGEMAADMFSRLRYGETATPARPDGRFQFCGLFVNDGASAATQFPHEQPNSEISRYPFEKHSSVLRLSIKSSGDNTIAAKSNWSRILISDSSVPLPRPNTPSFQILVVA